MKDSPRPSGRIVTLTTVPNMIEATTIVSMLQANGVKAMAGPGDADGWMPYMAVFSGIPVLVFDDDLAVATELLENTPPPPVQ